MHACVRTRARAYAAPITLAEQARLAPHRLSRSPREPCKFSTSVLPHRPTLNTLSLFRPPSLSPSPSEVLNGLNESRAAVISLWPGKKTKFKQEPHDRRHGSTEEDTSRSAFGRQSSSGYNSNSFSSSSTPSSFSPGGSVGGGYGGYGGYGSYGGCVGGEWKM